MMSKRLRPPAIALALVAPLLVACAPRSAGSLDLCAFLEPANGPAEDGPALADFERAELRLVSSAVTDPLAGAGECGQLFELVDDTDGARVFVGFSHIYGPDDDLDDERDIAPTLTIPDGATLRVRYSHEDPWSHGPTLVVEDEEGILFAGQSSGVREDFPATSGLEVDEAGDALPHFASCGTVTPHRLRFGGDTSAELEVGETTTISASGVELEVRAVGASTFEDNGQCFDTRSGTFRSWLAVRQ